MNLENLIKMEVKRQLRLFNTASRRIEMFKPINGANVGMYTCGPTVYGRAHVGNMRAYIFADVLRRTLEYAGYKVLQAMNITDVGHLTSDADTGEDKMEKSAREERMSAWDISKKYTQLFFEDEAALNIQKPQIVCKATDHIPEQIDLIKKLEKEGYTYKTSDGIYFDTSKFSRYGDLARLDIEGLQAGARIEMGEKRNKTDFALWKFSKPEEKRDMEWDSPWGKGFPGWHIECSAMSMKYLGEHFDIHTGGIDHIPIHHTNEIAQSECATGKKFVNYWVHSDFLVLGDNEKMSKSLGNVINLDTLRERGFDPLAYRFLCLGAQYRKRILFGEEILRNASNSFDRLKRKVLEIKVDGAGSNQIEQISSEGRKYLERFQKSIFNDLNTPQGIATMWDMLGDQELSARDKYSLLKDFDKIFGLGLKKIQSEQLEVGKEIEQLLNEREKLRASKRWKDADKIRDKILERGYKILDTPEGPKLEQSNS